MCFWSGKLFIILINRPSFLIVFIFIFCFPFYFCTAVSTSPDALPCETVCRALPIWSFFLGSLAKYFEISTVRGQHAHAHRCTHTRGLWTRVCDLKWLCVAVATGCRMIPESVIGMEISEHHQSWVCDCMSPVFLPFSVRRILSAHSWWFLPTTRLEPRDILICDPQRVRAGEIYQSDGNFCLLLTF